MFTASSVVYSLYPRISSTSFLVVNLFQDSPGLTLRLVDRLTLLGTCPLADQWGVTKVDLLHAGRFLILDEALLDKVLFALFLLLGLKVGGVGDVTPLGVTMPACYYVVVLGLLDHYDLVDTPLAGSGNAANTQINFVSSLTGGTGIHQTIGLVMVVMVMIIVVVVIEDTRTGNATVAANKWENIDQIATFSDSVF
jgi:hypothetical protein